MNLRYVWMVSMLHIIYAIPLVILGNERDAHGCLESAGYHWCESTEACQRSWELPCIPKS